MIISRQRVRQRQGKQLVLETVPGHASCNACQWRSASQSSALIVDATAAGSGLQSGDELQLGLAGRQLLCLAAMAYGLPLLSLFVTLGLVAWCWQAEHEVWSLLGLLGGLLISAVGLRFMQSRLATRIQPVILPADAALAATLKPVLSND